METVKLKLCLASRPEPVFIHRLQQHPGLVIHDHTWDEIDIYITERFRKQLSRQPRSIKSASIKKIKDTLLKSAEGVFIWVRCAMDELIKAFPDGGNDEELEIISQELRPGLEDMYDRAIQRASDAFEGASARREQRHSLEMHIMFTIALSTTVRYSRIYRELGDFASWFNVLHPPPWRQVSQVRMTVVHSLPISRSPD